jgi:NAD(P)-dependent dehydrogenase (short-subunit alcohol dehydrogenase family)
MSSDAIPRDVTQQLADRTAIITGAASGIGRGIAETLAEAGANIVVADIRREPKQGKHFDTDVETPTDDLVVDEYGVESLYVETDTRDPDDVERMVDRTVERFGGLDILVNNAGIQVLGTTQDISVEEWHRVMDVNATGYFLTAKFAFPALHESPSGRIVNLSSINANFGGGGAPYATSKAGVVNLTRDMAIEAAETDVTVNAVLPGVVKTPMQDQNDPETMERQEEATLLSRLGEPEDVGKAVRFLASDDAEWITGAQLLVDGGYSAAGY